MSLLDTGPEVLTLRPSVRDGDSDGNRRWRSWSPGDPEYTLTGVQVEPASTETEVVNGQGIATTVQAYVRALPEGVSGEYCQVLWDGRVWQTEGTPKRWRRGWRTRHVVLTMVQSR